MPASGEWDRRAAHAEAHSRRLSQRHALSGRRRCATRRSNSTSRRSAPPKNSGCRWATGSAMPSCRSATACHAGRRIPRHGTSWPEVPRRYDRRVSCIYVDDVDTRLQEGDRTPAARSSGRSRTSSGATAWGRWRIRSATSGALATHVEDVPRGRDEARMNEWTRQAEAGGAGLSAQFVIARNQSDEAIAVGA